MSGRFAPLQHSDLPVLHGWLQRPHAAAWWQLTPTFEALQADDAPRVGGVDSTRAYMAHPNGEPLGFIQCCVVMGAGEGWREDETDPGARGH